MYMTPASTPFHRVITLKQQMHGAVKHSGSCEHGLDGRISYRFRSHSAAANNKAMTILPTHMLLCLVAVTSTQRIVVEQDEEDSP